MRRWLLSGLFVIGTALLGATVLREPIASAAQAVNANITGPLDGDGNVKVHEQGTANVHVGNANLPVPESVTTAATEIPIAAPGEVKNVSVGSIDASTITITNMGGRGLACVQGPARFGCEMSFPLEERSEIVLPLTQPVNVQAVSILCQDDSPQSCGARFNVLGD
jgi:hypothetical protein